MKRLVITIVIAMLLAALLTGCAIDVPASNKSKLDRFRQNHLDKFLQQQASIGAIGRFNYNNIMSPFRLGSVPTNQFDWQQWNMMNSKLGKHFMR